MQIQSHVLGEVAARSGRLRAAERPENVQRTSRSRRTLPALHRLVEPLAHHAPVAEVLGENRNQVQVSSAQLLYLLAGGLQNLFRLRLGLGRQDQQELPSAARSEQNLRQPELTQQSTRQHFTQQRDPA